LIAKNSAWVIEGLLFAAALIYTLRRDRNVARAYADRRGHRARRGVADAGAQCRALRQPGLSGLRSDLHPLLYRLNRSTFTPAPATFYRET